MAVAEVPEIQPQTIHERADVEVPESWLGYSWYLVKKAGHGTYGVAHYLGGKLAHMFGVTSPDWQFAIDIHQDMEREDREEREQEERALRHLQERRTKALREMESQNTG